MKDDDGEPRTEIVPADEYTHVRWVATTSFESGTDQFYSYRVRVSSE